MDTGQTTTGHWDLTDEEWCELCFMVIEIGSTRDRLEKTLLAEERPSLHELWTAMSDYRRSSDEFMSYLATRLRVKAGIEHRLAA